jgi:GTP-binding protein Era
MMNGTNLLTDSPGEGLSDALASTVAPTRAGFVVLAGRPNAGKSTLLNQLLGTRLSIVTPKAQTTWAPVTGLLTVAGAQAALVDTPGLLERPGHLMHRALIATVKGALEGCDAAVWVIDAGRPPTPEELSFVLDLRSAAGRRPFLVALNKMDQADPAIAAQWPAALEGLGVDAVYPMSAELGDGIPAFLSGVMGVLPEGPFLFPEDDLAVAPVRFFVSEILREVVLEQFHEEIPWSVLPRIESFEDGRDGRPTVIHAVLLVERASQKGMLIGKGGAAIRSLGSEARRRIEALIDGPVYLDLRVKVLAGWRKKAGILKGMGLTVPDEAVPRIEKGEGHG